MPASHIEFGEIEPIQVFAVNSTGLPLTGLTDLFVRIRRDSDGFFFDFSDSTYKTELSIIQLESAALGEVSATATPGLYELSGGFDASAATNEKTDDEYTITAIQTPGTNATLPTPEKVRVGGISPEEAHLAVAYDQTGPVIRLKAWLTRGSRVITNPTSATITWRNQDGTTLFTNGPNSTPQSSGMFLFTQAQALGDDQVYDVQVDITDAEGTVTTNRGTPTVS